MATTYPYVPGTTASALADAFIIQTMSDPVSITSHDTLVASAKYVFGPMWNEILGLIAGRMADSSFQQAYTCGVGDAVGDAVQVTGNTTVAKALGTVDAQIFGFIRHKGSLNAASTAGSTTCYLTPFRKTTGLSGGTAGGPVYITDAGGYSSTPGTYVIGAGTWISTTVAVLFGSPVTGLSGKALSVLGRASNTAGALASIVAANDGEILARIGTAVGFNNFSALTAAEVAIDDTIPIADTSASNGNRKITVDKLFGLGCIGTCQGRLTLTTGVPVTTGTVSGSTMYFTPYKGNKIALYDGTRWNLHTFSELSLALSGLTDARPYDVFVYSNSGTPTLEFLIWTSDTARATAIAISSGVAYKTGDLTRRYVGSFRTTATNATEDSPLKRFVINYYNRVPRTLHADGGDSGGTATTTTTMSTTLIELTSFQALAIGITVVEDAVFLNGFSSFYNSGSNYTWIAISDVLVTNALRIARNYSSGVDFTQTISFVDQPALGYHKYFLACAVSAGTGTFQLDLGGGVGETATADPIATALDGVIFG